ncbi:polyprenyl synthetase family protein [Algivirga pacifica]|uniref:Polyprenyl synthetase family protein n=1 Tax=Algivirga pacifica TaxID=1162670 RepID=A0ABP9D5L9_9BACT
MSFNFELANEQITSKIEALNIGKAPNNLYDPIYYTLSMGGKRTRPILALLGCYLYNENYLKAMGVAMGVEIFHNFTLVHDDIMDNAPLRRGKATVHEKWNNNIAILSGDVMLVKAYEQFLDTDPALLGSILQYFNKCASEVCEGQQYDMDFENEDNVSAEEYLHMIRLKTAVLLGFSLRGGALVGGASEKDAEVLAEIAELVGTGFQLKDDILDLYGEQAKVGKQIGGDIIANKKTYLLIKALEQANEEQKNELEHWLSLTSFDNTEKVEAVKALFDTIGVKAIAEEKMHSYFQQAFQLLKGLEIPEERKASLHGFIEMIYSRDK